MKFALIPCPGPTSKMTSRIALMMGTLLLPLTISHAAEPAWTVVASGLNNPRGLDFAPNGALYIAEAGLGGDGPVIVGGDGPHQFGHTGSITRVWKGKQERLVQGLPSLAVADQTAAIGPSSISFNGSGHALLTIGLGANPALRNSILGEQGRSLGTVSMLNQNGQIRTLADLAAFELVNDPDGNGPDSNPNGVLNDKGGVAYVTDAGANALLSVAANGKVSVVAVFPNRIVPTPPILPQPPFPPALSSQAVPTNVVRGPDGALYVSQLTGFPFPVGGARVFRVVPGSAPQVYAEGFTNIIDLEFDAQGNLYVLEIDRNGLIAPEVTGRLARVNAGSHTVDTVASDGLVMPGGMAIGPDGAIYISNFSTSPGIGEVIRLATAGKTKKK